ncbi:MAG: penicillin-binding protein 2 [Clostridiales Family XIII bacterium]|jgi:stage V sporulation protein D (sporulation-specific penicillin-binding protein)|nr:penicillin-binding protein 2 [Clostridiales Family XIII bacterium]
MNRAAQNKREAINGEMLQRRVIVAFAVIVIAFLGLAFRLGWIQIVKTDIYAVKAQENQIKEQIIPARRGSILDRNMKELAISAGSYEVYIRLKPYGNEKPDPLKQQEQRKSATELLSAVLGIDEADIEAKLESENSRVRIAKDVDKNKIGLIREGINDRKLSVIEVEEDAAREYPMGAFAAHVLGTVGRDGTGLGGIELQYNDFLSGKAGRRIVNTDRAGNPLEGGETEVATDGANVVLTIDETIQYYVENAIEKAYTDVKAERVEAVVLDPRNGDVLAMATYPDYDPNDPGKPVDEKQLETFKGLEAEEQSKMINSLWRNPVVSDLYEPGSVFKLITAASGIESGSVTTDSKFTCKGSYHVADRNIRCWVYPESHGTQTTKQAVGNSCNPAMIQIAQKMGSDTFYKYMQQFGVTESTGIDYPGEAKPIIQPKDTSGPVGLATMAFGMGLNVTPIEMASAISAIANGGDLFQPRLVKALADNEGNITQEFPAKMTRKVLSKQTSDEMKEIMEYTVDDAGAKAAQIPGYRIGAKTGTAQRLVDGKYGDGIVGSIVAVAPMEDPQFVVLVVVSNPEIGEFGSTTAGPAVKEILTEILRYKSIKPSGEVE